MDVSTLAGVLAERLLRTRALSRQGVLRQFRRRGRRGRDQVRARRHRPAGHRLLRPRLPRPDLRRAVAERRSNFRDGFEPLLPGCTAIPFNDLAALEQALSSRDVAAFIVEPIQGKGVNMPSRRAICRAPPSCAASYGTLFVADEIQTGLGRTGRFLAVEHWGVEPDMVLLAKALSGGHVPVGAVLTRKSIFDKIFNRMDRAVVHGSTFAKNDLAMAAGIATLDVIEAEKLVENAAQARRRTAAGADRGWCRGYEMVKEVRGKGLMIGVEFGPPKSLRAEGVVERARDRQQGPVLPAHHHPAVQGPQDPDARSPATAATPSSCCRR